MLQIVHVNQNYSQPMRNAHQKLNAHTRKKNYLAGGISTHTLTHHRPLKGSTCTAEKNPARLCRAFKVIYWQRYFLLRFTVSFKLHSGCLFVSHWQGPGHDTGYQRSNIEPQTVNYQAGNKDAGMLKYKHLATHSKEKLAELLGSYLFNKKKTVLVNTYQKISFGNLKNN